MLPNFEILVILLRSNCKSLNMKTANGFISEFRGEIHGCKNKVCFIFQSFNPGQ